jgi:hypothetical protein
MAGVSPRIVPLARPRPNAVERGPERFTLERRSNGGTLLVRAAGGEHTACVSLRDDVVLRMIHQLVEALLNAAGLRKKKDLPAAEEALGEGIKTLGLTLDLIKSVPSSTLKGLVKDDTRRAMLGTALCELAAIARARGDDDDADRLDDCATDLFLDVNVKTLPPEVRDMLPADVVQG